jgi:hypothetical protein
MTRYIKTTDSTNEQITTSDGPYFLTPLSPWNKTKNNFVHLSA